MTHSTRSKVVIIGTGFSGLGQAIALRKAGIEDFVILEKATEVGGTWRDNSYPGCACDVQSHMYSFSFEQNSDWTRTFSGRDEIFTYLRKIADKYRLRRYVRFGVEVTAARWDEAEHVWRVHTAAGEEYVGQYLVSGIGALHVPNIPTLPGIENFRGRTWHSARWDHDFDLRGRRVAVVGTGASAIQFVPRIAEDVSSLHLFQRTPPWVLPKPDRRIPPWLRRVFRTVPGVQSAYRILLYWWLEVRALGFNGHPWIMRGFERLARQHMKRSITEPWMRRALTPDYTMGCKRILLSNDFYPALTRDNVALHPSGVQRVTERGVIDGEGTEHEVDAIIYGTGFHVTDAYEHLDITGAGGRELGHEWSQRGIRTHLGITVAGFPNLFFLLGPNTGLGHMSVVFMIEQQIKYVTDSIALADQRAADGVQVRHDVQEEFNRDIQHKLHRGVWTQGGCTSWYLDAQGVNRTVWPGFTWRYWMLARKPDPDDFSLVTRSEREPIG